MARPDRPAPIEPETPVAVQVLPTAGPRTALAILPRWLPKLLIMVVGLLGFILALQLLKQGAKVYGGEIIRILHVSNVANTLGFGWLLAYIFLSGSPVAAIAVSFFAAGTITDLQAFTMITGSRLGASFIVLFVGFVYYLRGHQRAASISIGVLALMTTAAIYLPALAIGYWLLTSGVLRSLQVSATTPMSSVIDAIFDPILDMIKQFGLPGWAIFVLGIGTLLLGFNLLDRALPEMN